MTALYLLVLAFGALWCAWLRARKWPVSEYDRFMNAWVREACAGPDGDSCPECGAWRNPGAVCRDPQGCGF